MKTLPALLVGLTILLSSLNATANEVSVKVLEIVTFEQAHGVEDKDVANAMNEFTPFMNKYGTLLLRSVSKAEDGSWKTLNYWTDRDAMKAFNADVQSMPEFGNVAQYIDFDTLSIDTYDVVGLTDLAK